MADLRPIEVVTLAALSDGALHGYGLVLRIAEITDGRMRVRPGNLYRVLHRLETAGLVTESAAPAGEADADERRRYFRITPKGRRVAAADLGMYAAVLRQSSLLRELKGGA